MSMLNNLLASITLYAGGTILISGLCGNLLNIRLLWRNRRNPCAYFFLHSSVINCLVLILGLFTRILSVSFNVDWAKTDRVWCKIRVAFSQSSFLISLTLVCLTSIDRMLISSRKEKYRRLSRLSVSQWSTAMAIIVWCLHSIPHLVLADLIPTTSNNQITFSCSLTPNHYFPFYQTYFLLPLYLGVAPTSALLITGLITYSNSRQIHMDRQRQYIQRQLTSMMLTQIPIIILSTLPYVIINEYLILTSTAVKSSSQRSLESFLNQVFTLLFYGAFSCQFFVFFVSSKSFRKETKRFVLCRHPLDNRVQPTSINMNLNTKNIQTF